MLRSLIRFICLSLVILGVRSASAFSLLGEFDNWQLPEVGFTFGEIGGSKNLGEEFRLNTPSITYGFDSTFLDYFGANGVKAVDQAFAILNKLPAASRMKPDLSEFLTDDALVSHPTAEALNLLDLKSETLGLLVEYLGLAGEEHVFDLRKRVPFTSPIPCQFFYQVIVRNFDPITYEPTKYVNGTLYTYRIFDNCPVQQVAFAEEEPVDPTDPIFTAVASFKNVSTPGFNSFAFLAYGRFYLNLSRDDAGGLRYMYRKNNYNNEVLPTNARPSVLFGPFQPVGGGLITTNATNTAALRAGIEKVTFRKVTFNSQLGTFFQPFVQSYSLTMVTNGRAISQPVRRAVFRPDILFTAADLNNLPPANPSIFPSIASRTATPRYLTNGTPVFFSETSVGPGTVIPQTVFTFHKAGPTFFNQTPFFLNEVTADQGFLWGSFDGSTNDPIIYPQGTSIRTVEQQVLNGRF